MGTAPHTTILLGVIDLKVFLCIESLDLPDNVEQRQHIVKSIEKFLEWRYDNVKSGACPVIPRDDGYRINFKVEVIDPCL
ncbi:MAG: hypothetical protein QQN63_13230 [Nitrosopumilus sp.]